MKNKFLTILFLSSILFTANSCISKYEVSQPEEIKETQAQPKNIVLLIGDGMGLSQASVGHYYLEEASSFDRFETIGLIKTSSSSELITDSAAGATAFSAGVKTYNKAIGVDANKNSVETILETLSKDGLSTGLVSTSSITHATPASFYAHVDKRSKEEEIATFMASSGIDIFIGGGLKFFNKRKDQKNLLLDLEKNGFLIDTLSLPEDVTQQKHAILLGHDEMPKMLDGRGDYLSNATSLALKKLSQNEKGFFLMVEASQIDWGGHDNDADYLISEQLDFDRVIGEVLDFAEVNGETLVIVTADHETGGFTLAAERGDYDKIIPSFSTDSHSGTMVPVFSKGVGSVIFGGIYENNMIYDKMMSFFTK